MVSGTAMLFGTMALILVLSVLTDSRFGKIIVCRFYPDIAITAVEGKTFETSTDLRQKLSSINYIDAYSFVLEENALLEYSDRQHICTVKGVDKNYFNVVKKFDTFMVDGKKSCKRQHQFLYRGCGRGTKLGMNAVRHLIR
ncbi:MAG: hypothetical protein IPP60_07625 [Sphingobacteriales bacterium]|nr:hypothetical protein [Sphingobacteriales bacterium]